MFTALKQKVKNLKSQIVVVYYAYQSPKVGFFAKAIVAIAIGYALSPIDLIPDFIPIVGYLDDLIIVPALLTLAIRLIPNEIMSEARKRAEEEPLRLGKNWVFASIFVAIWLVAIFATAVFIIGLFKSET